MSAPYETIITQANIIETENKTYLDSLKEQACEEVVRRCVDKTIYSLHDAGLAKIPSYQNGVTLDHDFSIRMTDDITAYNSSIFYKTLIRLDTNNQVEITSKKNEDNFTSGDTLTFCKLSDTLYNQIQIEIRATPVFTELQRVADTFKNANGIAIETVLSDMSTQECYIFFRILGMNAIEIQDVLDAKTIVALPHYPGLSIHTSPDNNIVLAYNPESTAETAARKTLLWSQTGEQITLGLGKNHLSPRIIDSLSEGYIPSDDYNKFDSRYGNGYADITRLLSSCIGRDIESIKTILWDDPDHNISSVDQENWLNLSKESQSFTVREFFRILVSVCSDEFTEQDKEMDTIPHYAAKKIISYRDGSCKDAESYYCTADSARLIQSSPNFLEKCGYGVNTALVLSPIYVHTTLLSPGHLVKLDKDELGNITGVQPLRCTMFMFEESEAKSAFGTQYEDTRDRLDRAHITPLTNLRKNPF